MFKNVFVASLIGLFCLSASDAKLRKIEAPTTRPSQPATKTSATPAVQSPLVSARGVEFVYVNPRAKSVFVAGSFNNWNPSKDAMVKDAKGIWRLLLALKAGVHQYKFVVDGNWIIDPANPKKVTDPDGNENSVVDVKKAPVVTGKGPQVTEEGVKFVYKNPAARRVFLAGDFNNWSQTADPMVKQKDGSWLLTKTLPRGKHLYKFVVDGNWLTDPSNPNTADDGFGGKNSVIEVKLAAVTERRRGAVSASAPRQTKSGVEFSLVRPAARSVSIAGSFNNWSTSSHPLSKDKNGVWKIVIPLGRGVYNYKFVVDGNWIQDPSNPKSADDGYGGKNSVVEVK